MSARGSVSAGGELAGNIAVFVRVLRAAGLRLGPGDTVAAVRAAAAVDITRRADLFWALHGVLVTDPRDREIFCQVFARVFRDPAGAEAALSLLAPSMSPAFQRAFESGTSEVSRRVAEALARRRPGPTPGRGKLGPGDDDDDDGSDEGDEIEFDAAMSWSDREALRHRDFEDMSTAELAAARAAIADLDLGARPVPTRRYGPDTRGANLDARATFRALARTGVFAPRWRARRRRPPPLVLICDISGSMERYSRMLLVLAHALTAARQRVASFVFGTRLTNITRHLRHRDVDVALSACGEAVADWGGGTRIGACIEAFNRDWSRRVLAQGAVVLLVTDGLERDDDAGDADRLGPAMARLHRSCRRLVWLNPLLRYAQFAPRAWGIRQMLPHVDAFRPVHNLASLEQLAAALRGVDRLRGLSGRDGRTGGRTSRESMTTGI